VHSVLRHNGFSKRRKNKSTVYTAEQLIDLHARKAAVNGTFTFIAPASAASSEGSGFGEKSNGNHPQETSRSVDGEEEAGIQSAPANVVQAISDEEEESGVTSDGARAGRARPVQASDLSA
jgi:hypothetical protein